MDAVGAASEEDRSDHLPGAVPGVSRRTHGLDDPAIVSGDTDQLRRITRNLIHNAEQHERESIAVRVTLDDHVVRLVVGDDGPGVPFDQRSAVFERFVRLDTARTRDVGATGLGLAIVADVIASHRGKITAVPAESPSADEGQLMLGQLRDWWELVLAEVVRLQHFGIVIGTEEAVAPVRG